MTNGYFGKILWIDLSEGTFKEENLPEEYYRSYLGGYGLATKLLYENKGLCKKMGWNPENAYPLEETLNNLNLEFVIKDLY